MRLLLQIAPRAYRVSASTIRFFSNSVDLVQSGVFGTLNWRGSFVRDGKAISPWHDLSIKPLGGPAGFYTYVNEIPAGSFEKIEVSTDEAWNPLKQDAKKGKPRLYGLRTKFNYGCFPQTWENPWRHSQRIAAVGDGDPLDAVELGWLGGGLGPLPLGSVSSVRVLGCLALIDEGEVDWKVPDSTNLIHPTIVFPLTFIHQVIVARQEHPLSLTTGNVDLQLIAPDIVNDVREWFRTYKTFEGKGLNEFGFGGRCLTSVEAEEVLGFAFIVRNFCPFMF